MILQRIQYAIGWIIDFAVTPIIVAPTLAALDLPYHLFVVDGVPTKPAVSINCHSIKNDYVMIKSLQC